MPLVVFTGLPSPRKTDAVEALVKFFEEEACVSVTIVRETDFVNDPRLRKGMRVYLDSKAERELRGKVKAEVVRQVGKDRLVVLDGLNYVKGYRYELYCISKAARTTQCTIYAENTKPTENGYGNENYDEEETPGYDADVMKMLRQRYEVPDGKNRWDSPLFRFDASMGAEDGEGPVKLPLEAIRKCLYDRAPPPANKSTETQPLSSTDYLQKLDEATRSVLSDVGAVQKLNPGQDVEVLVSGVGEKVTLPSSANAPVLARLRRQFISFSKTKPMADSEVKIKALFVQYLNSNFGD